MEKFNAIEVALVFERHSTWAQCVGVRGPKRVLQSAL